MIEDCQVYLQLSPKRCFQARISPLKGRDVFRGSLEERMGPHP